MGVCQKCQTRLVTTPHTRVGRSLLSTIFRTTRSLSHAVGGREEYPCRVCGALGPPQQRQDASAHEQDSEGGRQGYVQSVALASPTPWLNGVQGWADKGSSHSDAPSRGGPAMPISRYPSPSTGIAGGSVFSLLAVGSAEHQQVLQTFVSGWDSTRRGQAPPLVGIVKIEANAPLVSQYTIYRQQITRLRGARNINESRLFHGTRMHCTLLATVSTNGVCAPCTSRVCAICSISQYGFDDSRAGEHVSWQRFGSGIYLAPNSSKCHDYTIGAYGLRAMLLCDVVLGVSFVRLSSSESLCPPPGCDSVYGKASTHGRLNYDEYVVYDKCAALPRYVLLYQLDGVRNLLG